MDIDLARTFLEIASAGTLGHAAERLHITQATVSARLQNLETIFDRKLFIRNKAGARLTPAGHDFLPFATQLIQTWQRATREVGMRQGMQGVLTLGGEHSLWSALLLNWLVTLRKDRKNVVLRTQVDTPARLLDGVQNGALEIAVLYSPHRRPGVAIEPVLEEELIAVSTRACTHLTLDNYVYVDWGPDFEAQHEAQLPELSGASTSIGLGPLALHYLLQVGGSGYFRARAVEPYLKEKRLHLVRKAPPFSYSLYAAYSESADVELLDWAKECLSRAATTPSGVWA